VCPDVCPSSSTDGEAACSTFGDCCMWEKETAGKDWCAASPNAESTAKARAYACNVDDDCTEGQELEGQKYCVRASKCIRNTLVQRYNN